MPSCVYFTILWIRPGSGLEVDFAIHGFLSTTETENPIIGHSRSEIRHHPFSKQRQLNDLQACAHRYPECERNTASLNGSALMLNFWKDIQYAFRTLTKNPGFALIGIVTLALGMAVNTTLFSVVNGFLLRPLPVPHPEQITVLSLKQSALPGNHRFSYPDYEDLRDQADTFSDILAYRVTLSGVAVGQKPDHCIISRVSSNYFSSLGVKPAYGRLILPTEGRTPACGPHHGSGVFLLAQKI